MHPSGYPPHLPGLGEDSFPGSPGDPEIDQAIPSGHLIPPGVQEHIDFYVNAKRINWVSGKVEKSEEFTELIQEAKRYRSDQKFTEALIAYGQAIGLLHPIGTRQAYVKAAKIVGQLMRMLFEQHPELGNSEEALESPKSCCAFALLHLLPDENDEEPDRQLLSSLGHVAEWLGKTTLVKYEDPETADTLFESIDMLMRRTMMGELDHFMIIFKWASLCGGQYAKYTEDYADSDSILDGWKAESLFSVALCGFDSTLGRLHPQTIQCALSLSKMYLHRKNYLLAEALCDYLYRAQLEAGHDTSTDVMTLHTLLRLVRCYMATKRWEKTGRLIWSFPQWDYLPQSSQVRNRWDEHLGGSNIRKQFQTEAAPYSCKWVNQAVSCLPIRRIEFKPSSFFMDHAHEADCCPTPMYEAHHELQVVDDKCINLCFMSHTESSSGMKVMQKGTCTAFDLDSTVAKAKYLNIIGTNPASRTTNRKTNLTWIMLRIGIEFGPYQEDGFSVTGSLGTIPVWSLTEEPEATIVKGFLNEIPGDTALVQESLPYSLVSSRWVDYRRFFLHSASEASIHPCKLAMVPG